MFLTPLPRRLPTFMDETAGCGCPKMPPMIDCLHAKTGSWGGPGCYCPTCHPGCGELWCQFMMYGIYDIVDEVELVLNQVLRELVSTPVFFVHTMCVGRVYTCVYICLHIYTPSLLSLHVCGCVCMFTCTHTDLRMCVYICTYTCLPMGVCIFLHHVCVCVYLHVGSTSLHVWACIFTYMHNAFTCVCV